ncbi:MAG: hypothetical protein CVU46_01080 [Chloroflexi bacterium HGW-Chloroflexi-8]|nr:MAG: hypothetical protein CVU46_01080 [Chloroflexi bacterium HGW-Chloroflexi-8]
MIVIVIAILILTACDSKKVQPTGTNEIPNPASVFCKENGDTLEMRQATNESVAGFCIFPDGSGCGEWAYFRGDFKFAIPAILSTSVLGFLLAIIYLVGGRNLGPCIFAPAKINLVIEPWLMLSSVSGKWHRSSNTSGQRLVYAVR